MTEENLLLDAVDALSERRITKVVTAKNAGGISCINMVDLDPLLTALDDAIRGTIGIGGSGSLPNERNMLNNDALHKSFKIMSAIKEWARSAGSEIVKQDGAATLRKWYVAFFASDPGLEVENFHIRQMRSWQNQIEAMFDPPITKDLPDPCPICGAKSWFNPASGEEYARPLIIQYRETDESILSDGKGLCRACEAVWGVRELAFAIEEAGNADTGS